MRNQLSCVTGGISIEFVEIQCLIEKLIDDRYGAADLNSVLKSAMQKLPKPDQAILKLEEESLLHDETELVDNSVDYRFAGVTVHRL